MAKKTAQPGQLYVATESFVAQVDGVDVVFSADRTLVREGHEILERYPQMFKVAEAHFEVEQATAAPGERRAR